MGNTIQFLNNSFTLDTIVVTNWTFATATPSTSLIIPNPVVSFPSYGDWLVTLYVEDEFGCSNQIDSLLEIDNLPNVDFDWDDGCAGIPICFSDASSQSVNGNGLWLSVWDFGDGYSSVPDPCHPFNNVQQYVGACDSVTLTITDSLGCSNSKTHQILIHPLPEVLFTIPSGVCEGSCLPMEDESKFDSPLIGNCIDDVMNGRLWYIDDFSSGAAVSAYDSICYTLTIPGSHSIKLEVFTLWEDGIGFCKNDSTATVQYWNNPVLIPPYFTYQNNNQCGEDITFDFTCSSQYTDSINI